MPTDPDALASDIADAVSAAFVEQFGSSPPTTTEGISAAMGAAVGAAAAPVAAAIDAGAGGGAPAAHASTHAAAGSDPVSPSSIGALAAASNLSDVADAEAARDNLGLGTAATASTSDFDAAGLADAALAGAIAASCQRSSNLSDLASTSTARGNLGLGTMATRNVGTASGTGAAGDDSRFPPAPSSAGRIIYDDGSAWQALTAALLSGRYLGRGTSGLPAWLFPLQGLLFGDGSDGPLSVAGATSLGSVGLWTDVTIANGGILTPGTYIVVCGGTFTLQSGGTLNAKGTDASGATGATGLSGGYLPGYAAATSGTTGVGGGPVAQSYALGGSGGAGGAGVNAGGASAAATQAALRGHRRWGLSLFGQSIATGGTVQAWVGGINGSAGGGDGASKKGGGGGRAGSRLLVIAPRVVLESGSTVDLRGGNGGNGESGGGNTGGGGGGGAGWGTFVTPDFTDNGATWLTSGGSGGTASGGTNGSAGGNAGTGYNGLTGGSTTGYDVVPV